MRRAKRRATSPQGARQRFQVRKPITRLRSGQAFRADEKLQPSSRKLPRTREIPAQITNHPCGGVLSRNQRLRYGSATHKASDETPSQASNVPWKVCSVWLKASNLPVRMSRVSLQASNVPLQVSSA